MGGSRHRLRLRRGGGSAHHAGGASLTVREHLLDLHRALVASEREQYERARGRVSDQEFLEALLNDAELRWLAPLTALVARLEGAPQEETLQAIRGLLKPDAQGAEFQRHYAAAVQRSADVAVAHGRIISALR